MLDKPLTENDLIIPDDIVYRYPFNIRLNYEPGDCQDQEVNWFLPGSRTDNSTTAYSGEDSYGQSILKGSFHLEGEVCAHVVNYGNISNEVCGDFKLITEDVWGKGRGRLIDSMHIDSRTVNLGVDNFIYTGFGKSPYWNRFNINEWQWEPRSAIEESEFEAYTGFKLNNQIHIFGQNGVLYRYLDRVDEWNSVTTIDIDTEDIFQLNAFDSIKNEIPVYPLVSAALNNMAFIGIGSTGNFYSYDFLNEIWQQEASYPEPGISNINWFIWDNKIYVGNYYFDMMEKEWKTVPVDYSKGDFKRLFSVFADGVYYLDDNGITQYFDGKSLRPYAPREVFNYEERKLQPLIAMSAVAGDHAIIPTERSVFTSFFYFYRKR